MTAIPFCKFHGFGNDYIVIEADTIGDAMPLDQLARDRFYMATSFER